MAAEEWTRAECAAYRGIDPDTWSAYVTRGQAPAPARRVGRTPLWDAEAVRAMISPGQGARTDLKEPAMQPTAPAEPLTRTMYGREIRARDRAYRAIHVDGYAHIDLYVRREPRFESDRDDSRDEWVRVERYTTLDLVFDDTARRRFDAWVETELRAELDQPGKHLRTYRA